MNREPLNHYRALYVQPDAPPEVIKAAWRALMSARRLHPDLGGDHDEAVRLNTAYEVLGDPVRRAAYDDSLRRGSPGGRAEESFRPAADPPRPPPADAGPARRCLFCGQPHTAPLRRDSRCSRCDSPLTPLPERAPQGPRQDDVPGRRRDPRFVRDAVVELWLPGEAQARAARLLDLSFSGLQLRTTDAVPSGGVARVIAPWFDAVFTVVHCRPLRSGHAVHGRLQTLLMQQQARGVYVNARA
jgi:curved DNA-binding protein CbpA